MEISSSTIILGVLSICILLLVGYLVYTKLYKEEEQPIETYIPKKREIDENKPALLLFTSSHCPHARAFQPIWDEVVKKSEEKLNIDSFDIDSDMARSFRVKGTPTVLYLSGPEAQPEEYDGPRTVEGLLSFIDR